MIRVGAIVMLVVFLVVTALRAVWLHDQDTFMVAVAGLGLACWIDRE